MLSSHISVKLSWVIVLRNNKLKSKFKKTNRIKDSNDKHMKHKHRIAIINHKLF